MMETVLGVLAGSWAVVMAVSPILQIRRIVRMRSSKEVSIPYFGILVLGFLLWLAYGVAIANLALIIPNAVAAVIGLATIAVARRYR
jgi:MtN3 and saliva related transmembrane protein